MIDVHFATTVLGEHKAAMKKQELHTLGTNEENMQDNSNNINFNKENYDDSNHNLSEYILSFSLVYMRYYIGHFPFTWLVSKLLSTWDNSSW